MNLFRFLVFTVCFCCALSLGNRDVCFSETVQDTGDSMLESPGLKELSAALSHYVVGIFYDDRGKPFEAAREYRQAIELRDDIGPVYVKLGADLLLMGDADRALDVLKKALALNENDDQARLLRALVYASIGEYSKAETSYEQILERDPENLRALSFLSEMLITQGRFDEAIETYKKMLAISSDDTVLYFNLGMIYSKTDQLEKAEQSLKKAIEIDADYTEAQMVLGLVYEVEGDIDGAISQYETVENIDPFNKNAYARAGQLYFRTGKLEKALEQFRMMQRVDPVSSEPYLKIFAIYAVKKEYGEAEKTLLEALENGASDGSIYAGLGYMASENKEYEEAVRYYRMAVIREPRNNSYWLYLALALNDAGDTQEAIDLLEERAKEGVTSPEMYNCLGYLYAAAGKNLDRAAVVIRKALEKDPHNGAYNDSLGWVLYKQGRYPEALKYIKKAAGHLPKNATIQDHLGDVYFKLEEPAKAEEAWRNAAELDADNAAVLEKLKKLNDPTKGRK